MKFSPFDLASISPGTRLRSYLISVVIRQYGVKRLCDCGCGIGVMAGLIGRKGLEIVGFDINHRLARNAARNVSAAGFFTGCIENLPFGDASQSCLIACDLVEHLDNPSAAFKEIARVLAPGGLAIMTIPNRNFERIATLFNMTQEDIGHNHTYSGREIRQLVDPTGLVLKTHKHVCHVGTALTDIAIAKLALLLYGKDVVRRSEMALKTASSEPLAVFYYWLCLCCYPALHLLEHLLPERFGAENMCVLVKPNDNV